MNSAAIAEYRQVCSDLNTLEIKKEGLLSKKRKFEASEMFGKVFKKVKRQTLPAQDDPNYKKITCYFKPNPQLIVSQVLKNVLDGVLENLFKHRNNDLPQQELLDSNPLASDPSIEQDPCRRKKIQNHYSSELRKEVEKNLHSEGMAKTFHYYNRKIPRTTLQRWNKSLNKSKKTRGRKTFLTLMEERLFDWFLVRRARKITLRDIDLSKRALVIAKKILNDPEIKLSQKERDEYLKFQGSSGWLEKFKNRYKICSRAITTRCTKSKEYLQKVLKSYFEELNQTTATLKPKYYYNMDEVALFFELSRNQTLELKSKKVVGKLSSGKDKQRITLVVTACSNGSLLPPFIIFKTSKPKDKTNKDVPPNEKPYFNDEMKRELERNGVFTIQNYSAWNNNRIMAKYYLPWYKSHVHQHSLLVMDNCSCHCSDETTDALEEQDINTVYLAPNTTPLTQPVDIQIGRAIKSKIKENFETWLIENEEQVLKQDPKTKEWKFKSPDRNQIIKWVIQAYNSISRELIMQSFDKAGITDISQQEEIMNRKVDELGFVYEAEEFVYLEKRSIIEMDIK